MVRQVGGRSVEEGDDRGDVDRPAFDRLVLAELAIGDVQVAEIDAAKGLDVARQGLRIAHRRVDEIVELQVLDLEHLAHMRAAGLQQCDDLGAIRRLEMRLDRVRTRRDLAEREDDSQDLGEDQVHPGFRRPLSLRQDRFGRITSRLKGFLWESLFQHRRRIFADAS